MFVHDLEAVRTLGDGRQDANKEYEYEVWRRSWRSCRSWGTLMLMHTAEGPSVDFKLLVPPSLLACFVLPKISQNANVLLGKWYFLLCCKVLILQRLLASENDEGGRNFTIENRFSWKKLVLRERSKLFSPEMAVSFQPQLLRRALLSVFSEPQLHLSWPDNLFPHLLLLLTQGLIRENGSNWVSSPARNRISPQDHFTALSSSLWP